MKYKLFIALFLSFWVLGMRGEKFQEIETVGEVKYIKRASDAWREGGRLIGEIKNTPDKFTIKVMNVGTSKIVHTYTHPARVSIYQTGHIPPGTYDMLVESEGFHPFWVRNIKIAARTDCMINLVFGKRVFHND